MNIPATFIPPCSQRSLKNTNGSNQPQNETIDSPKTTIKIIPVESFLLEDALETQNSSIENTPILRSGRKKGLKNLAQTVFFTNRIKKKETLEVTLGASPKVNSNFKKFVRENCSLVNKDILTRNVSLENEKDSKV